MAKLTKTPIKVEKKVEKITFRLVFPDHTVELTQDEVNDLYDQLANLLGKKLSANDEVIKNLEKIFKEKRPNDPCWPSPPISPYPLPTYPCPEHPHKPYEIWCGFTTKDTATSDL